MNNRFTNSDAERRFAAHETELKQLAESEDGRRITKMLDSSSVDIASAVEHGDEEAMKSILASVLSTQEGARLAQKLSELLK